MPLYDYRCTACDSSFELLVRSSSTPACPQCNGTQLERLVSLTAAAGKSQALIAGARAAASKEGHFSNYSKAERRKLGVR
ncbi:MAG: zinc ribbon domain-containing protein [Rubrivivax sp.]|nr:zinc ribbon domain-containing protein [Rubrivivax sp.]